MCENLLLSYRLKEKFVEALDTIKEAFEFLALFNLDMPELEWLVINWCKIKRDLWKAKKLDYQHITIADHLQIREAVVDKFLLQEIRNYTYFK